jgi:sugar phosphate isomerase/epimerase
MTTTNESALPLRTAAITDEFSPDIDVALEAMSALGMTGAELRLVGGRNMLDLGNEEVDRVAAAVRARGMSVPALASPLLKCTFPGGPAIDPRFQQDVFGSPLRFEDQPRLARRAFEIAERVGAGIIRVFSYWRTIDPPRVADAIAEALTRLAAEANARGLVIGLENEPACNVGTGQETKELLQRVGQQPGLQVVWDPANAVILGETPFPDGYRALPRDRVAHVHAKDCRVRDFKPEWGLLGDMDVDWTGQLDALLADGYRGWVSLETHWRGPNGDKLQGSRLCGERLHELLRRAAAARSAARPQ